MTRWLRHWRAFWFDPMEEVRLDVFRRAFLVVAALYTAAWAPHGPEWLTALGYHPSLAVSPLYGPRVPLLPAWAVWPFLIGFVGALLAAAFARNTWVLRVALVFSLVGAIYVLQVDPISAFTINRLNVVVLFVLVLAPSARDGLRSSWPVRVLQVTLLLQYFLAGWCKVVLGDWPGDGDVLWMQVQGHYRTAAAAHLITILPRGVWAALQHAALAFELAAPVLFSWRRARPVALVAGVGMHAIIALTMESLIYFSLQMVTFYLLFLPARVVRRLHPLR